MDSGTFLAGFFIGLMPGLIMGAMITFAVMINIRAEAPTCGNVDYLSEMEDQE